MKKLMTTIALLAAVAPHAIAQEQKVPDAVAALEALESAPPIGAESADVAWNTGVYSYDGAGNITAIGSQYFVYDKLGRLVTAKVTRDYAGVDGVTQKYGYDIYGNLTQMTKVGGQTQSITVSAGTNRLAATGTGYDDAGNLTNWSAGMIGYVMKYDALGMPATLKASNAPIRAFVYTADDERLFSYDGGDPAQSHWTLRDIDGSVLRDYQLVGSTWSVWRDYYYRDGLMLASADASTELHYSLDHLGSPRLLTNAARQQVAFQTFLPFGEEVTPAPLDNGAVKKFTSHERDSDPSGMAEPLDYMHARFYNGRWGRFLSVDPTWSSADLSKPQSWNRYSYVLNNPVNFADPDGRCIDGCVVETLIVAGGITLAGAGHVWLHTQSPSVPGETNAQVLGSQIAAVPGKVVTFLFSGGGSSGEMAAETFAQNMANHMAEQADRPELPARDSTGKVHGDLPTPADVREYPTEELKHFQDELKGSVGERIKVTSQLGPEQKHGERQAAEQKLIKQIDKIIKDRE